MSLNDFDFSKMFNSTTNEIHMGFNKKVTNSGINPTEVPQTLKGTPKTRVKMNNSLTSF